MVSPGAVKATLAITVTLSAFLVSATHTSYTYTDNATHKSVDNDHNGATIEAEATVVLTAGKASKTMLNVAEGTKGNAAQAGVDVSEGLTSSKSNGAGQDAERDAEEAEDAEYAAASPTNFVLHDCFPDAGSPHVTLSADTCHQRHCDWDSTEPAGKPWCFLSRTQAVRYSVVSETNQGSSLHMRLHTHGNANYGGDFSSPSFRADFLSDTVLRFTFDDDGAHPRRYRVPMDLNLPSGAASNLLYTLQITSTTNFAFQIIRRSTGTVVFDTGVGGLILSDQYLQLATKLPSHNLYGLGESLHNSFRHPMETYPRLYPAFARDLPPTEGLPLYGVQPFYTCVEDSSGNTHGVLLLNSNAQEYTVTGDPMMTWRTIGGVLDFFVFLGPSPENVVQQYTELVGRPAMPPYWGLGFQMCKYGYNNLGNMKRAVSETIGYGIPLDVQYADIDHMDERKDFTVDNVNFAGLNDYWQSLRKGGMRTVIILDPCLAKLNNYEPYEKMKQVHGFIQWPGDVTPDAQSMDSDRSLLGNVWPDPQVAFPDFFKNATRRVWKELIVKHHQRLVFDGLWIDMNEPSNFMTNRPRPNNWRSEAGSPLQCGNNQWDDPPYRPLAVTKFDSRERGARMSDKTVCMNSRQGNHEELLHYNVHSLFGWSQTSITNEAARAATGERSMVITRSNFPGSGKYAGHWLGDNYSSWTQLRQSIIGMLEYNLFGIPFVGSDICGFNGNATPELCLRWMQLGAFYPFSRNHNSIRQEEQHPGHFGQEFATGSREILESRYWLLPYLYTLFHQVHTEGGTVVRPLHHEFPTDPKTLSIDRQFLWGPALLISPILEQGQTSLQFYVPAGKWYDFYKNTIYDGPRTVTVAVSYYSKPQLLMRGGYILPMQRPANNTAFSRRNPFTLKVMLDNGGSASGSLFWDDGTSIDNATTIDNVALLDELIFPFMNYYTYERGNYFLATFSAQKGVLRMAIQHNRGVPETNNLHFETIEIHGVTEANDVRVTSQGVTSFTHNFNAHTQVLVVSVTIPLTSSFTVDWSGHASLMSKLMGGPMVSPYWALGFQLCRYGYNTVAHMQKAVNELTTFPWPCRSRTLTTWMGKKTVDDVNFAGLSAYMQSLHDGTYTRGNYYLADFNCTGGQLHMTVRHRQGVPEMSSLHVEAVIVYGVGPVSQATASSTQHGTVSVIHSYQASLKTMQKSKHNLVLFGHDPTTINCTAV